MNHQRTRGRGGSSNHCDFAAFDAWASDSQASSADSEVRRSRHAQHTRPQQRQQGRRQQQQRPASSVSSASSHKYDKRPRAADRPRHPARSPSTRSYTPSEDGSPPRADHLSDATSDRSAPVAYGTCLDADVDPDTDGGSEHDSWNSYATEGHEKASQGLRGGGDDDGAPPPDYAERSIVLAKKLQALGIYDAQGAVATATSAMAAVAPENQRSELLKIGGGQGNGAASVPAPTPLPEQPTAQVVANGVSHTTPANVLAAPIANASGTGATVEAPRVRSSSSGPPPPLPPPPTTVGHRREGSRGPPSNLHPCIAQKGHCKFGRKCLYAKLPSDVCVHYLKGNCVFRDDTCRYRHLTRRILDTLGPRQRRQWDAHRLRPGKLTVIDVAAAEAADAADAAAVAGFATPPLPSPASPAPPSPSSEYTAEELAAMAWERFAYEWLPHDVAATPSLNHVLRHMSQASSKLQLQPWRRGRCEHAKAAAEMAAAAPTPAVPLKGSHKKCLQHFAGLLEATLKLPAAVKQASLSALQVALLHNLPLLFPPPPLPPPSSPAAAGSSDEARTLAADLLHLVFASCFVAPPALRHLTAPLAALCQTAIDDHAHQGVHPSPDARDLLLRARAARPPC